MYDLYILIVLILILLIEAVRYLENSQKIYILKKRFLRRIGKM